MRETYCEENLNISKEQIKTVQSQLEFQALRSVIDTVRSRFMAFALLIRLDVKIQSLIRRPLLTSRQMLFI